MAVRIAVVPLAVRTCVADEMRVDSAVRSGQAESVNENVFRYTAPRVPRARDAMEPLNGTLLWKELILYVNLGVTN